MASISFSLPRASSSSPSSSSFPPSSLCRETTTTRGEAFRGFILNVRRRGRALASDPTADLESGFVAFLLIFSSFVAVVVVEILCEVGLSALAVCMCARVLER